MPVKRTLSVIIPALNEEKNIKAAIRTVSEAVQPYFTDWEILVFDDGSTDDTGKIADTLAKKNPKIKVTHHHRPKNMGGCYKAGVKMATKDYAIMIPGDNEYNTEAMRRTFELAGSADLIIPYTDNMHVRPWGRVVLSKIFTLTMNLISGNRLRYYNGAVLHRTDLVRSCRLETDSFGFSAESIVKLLRKGHSFKEVPIEITYRTEGTSKALRPSNLIKVFKLIAILALQREAKADERAADKAA